MKKEEVKKRYSDSIAKGIMDEKIVNYVINKEIDDNDLYSTVESVCYTDVAIDPDKTCYYDALSKTFNIDSSVFKKCEYESELDLASLYSSVFTDIYKELTYAKHELLVQKWENYYSKLSRKYIMTPQETREIILFDLIKLASQVSRKKYHKYKSIFPSEHEANFYSQYKTMEFENEYNLYSKKADSYRVLVLTKLLLEGYKYNIFKQIVSPVERLQSRTTSNEEITNMMLNIFNSYERLVYGMPVSSRTINSIAEFSNDKVMPKCSTFEEVEKRLLKRK